MANYPLFYDTYSDFVDTNIEYKLTMRPLAHLRALQYFEKVAECNHLGDAAHNLGVTPSAVSKIIGQLEQIMGVKLLQKKGTGIQTTPEGRRLASEISAPFDQIEKAVNRLVSTSTTGPLTVTTVTSLASRWLIPNLNLIEEKMDEELIDGQHINILTGGGLADLWRENVDIGLRYGEGFWPGCEAIKLFPSEEVCTVSARLYPDHKPGEILNPWEQLPVLMRPKWESWNLFAEKYNVQGAEHRSQIPDDFLVIREAVLNGRGVAVLPPIMVHDLIADGQLVLVRPEAVEVSQTFYIVLPSEKPRSSRVDHLVDILVAMAKESLGPNFVQAIEDWHHSPEQDPDGEPAER